MFRATDLETVELPSRHVNFKWVRACVWTRQLPPAWSLTAQGLPSFLSERWLCPW